MKNFLLLSLFFSLTAQTSFGQFFNEYERSGNNAYSHKNYYAAAEYYLKALNGQFSARNETLPFELESLHKRNTVTASNLQLAIKLAGSYRLYSDFKNAERWYGDAIAVSTTIPDTIRYWYATCLRANKKYYESRKVFVKLQNSGIKTGLDLQDLETEIATCNFAINSMKLSAHIRVKKVVVDLHSAGSNYAAARLDNNTMLFTSSRPVPQLSPLVKVGLFHRTRMKDLNTTTFRSRLFEASGNKDVFSDIHEAGIPADPQHEQGAISLSPDKQTMILNKWLVDGSGFKMAALFLSHRSGDEWTTPEKMNARVNLPGYNSIQPAISTDGKYLFFASNRPGGKGGYDIWFSALDASFEPEDPKNAGSSINTKDDEKAPYYNSFKKQLTYSTNGLAGMGGMDLFSAVGEPGKSATPVNLGYPVNSSKDDVYYSETDTSGDSFYISSDRESSCCLEIFYMQREYSHIRGIVLDSASRLPVDRARIELVDPLNLKMLQQVSTGDDGKFSFTILPGTAATVIVSKKNQFGGRPFSYTSDSTAAAGTVLYSTSYLAKRSKPVPPVPPLPPVINKYYYRSQNTPGTENSDTGKIKYQPANYFIFKPGKSCEWDPKHEPRFKL